MTHAVRHAAKEDLPAIVAIYNAAVPSQMATADMEPVTVESRQDWFSAHSPQHWPVWVLEREGQVVGWLSLQPFYGRQGYRYTAEVSVYVGIEHRRMGVGREMLTHALTEAPSLGLVTLLAFVFGHNQPSLALFESMGFERWGLLPRIANMNGTERDLVILGRRAPAILR